MHDVSGRYRVTRRLGQGGMAEVFEAVSLGSGGFERRVAIKRLLTVHVTDASFGRMFLDEARIASQLHHGNIVAVLDYGVADGHPFQVLEYVDGMDAAHLTALGEHFGTPLPIELALAICTDIAHALEHAHTATDASGRLLGIVHRDVSPANILVSWSGDVKLTDFGIAFARGRLETTSAGIAKGTLLYMAPEQIMRGAIDGRTDLFSLGCVLHTLVSGVSPLARESAMADLVAGAPLVLSDELPPDVRPIVARATLLARDARYATAGEMAGVLGAVLARRIATDPKSLVRDWLQQLRRASPPPPAGKLDGLLGADLIFSGTRATANGRADVEPNQVERPARRRFYRLQIAAAATPLVIAGLALALWPRGASEEMHDAPLLGDAATAPVPPVMPPLAPFDAPPELLPIVDASASSSDAPRRVIVPHRPSPPAPLRPDAAVRPSAGIGVGTMAIGGELAVRAEIFVDGVARGFAPRTLQLPAGEHEVVLVLADGKRFTHRIQLLATHTPSAPYRLIVNQREP